MTRHRLFEWDPPKARSNAQKHRGVTFEDAKAVLMDDQAELYHVEKFDDQHSILEDRYITIGSDPADRAIVLFISWTQRQTRTRIISARRATPRERTEYAKAIKKR